MSGIFRKGVQSLASLTNVPTIPGASSTLTSRVALHTKQYRQNTTDTIPTEEKPVRKPKRRVLTADEATGLVSRNDRDLSEFKYPGNIELNTDRLMPVPEENKEDVMSPAERHEQIISAARRAVTPLSQSILSLALMPPEVEGEDPLMDKAKALVLQDLQSAPHWDETDNESTRLETIEGVTRSNRLLQENDRDAALEVVQRKQADGIIESNNAILDEVNRAAVARGDAPMPDFTKDFPELSHEDLRTIDNLAEGIVQSVKMDSSAKQPYDTASMVVKARVKDLPVDIDAFFRTIGMSSPALRTSQGYMRYLRVLSVKGTVGQALSVWSEMKARGIPLSIGMFTEMIAVCKRPIIPEEKKAIVDYMMINKPDVTKAIVYPTVSPHMSSYNLNPPQPPTAATPNGAPEGFVSVAPQFATYGAPHRRTRFNEHVELAFYLFEQSRASGIVPDLKLYSAVIGVCAEQKQAERAFAVFEQLKRHANGGEDLDPDYVPTKINRELMKAPAAAKSKDLKADNIVATQLMKACWTSGKFFEAEELFHHMWSFEGITPDAPMYNLMIRIAADTSHVEKAFKYFEQLQHFGGYPSLITYTSLIHACIQPKRPEFYPRAYEVFHECVAAGFRPNEHLFNTLLHACAEQADLQNGLNVWRLLSAQFPHLRTEQSFTIMMRLIGRTMDHERLPGFGGSVVTKGSRTLYGPVVGINAEADDPETQKVQHLTREERISMAEALYADFLLAMEGKDVSEGKAHQRRLKITSLFMAELINIYSKAAVGIMRYDRREREEGREDPHLRVTEKMIMQMVERTWKRVSKLKEAHPDTFELSEHMYTGILEIYGAADLLEQAMVHYDYMVKHLKVPVSIKIYNAMLTWARRNRHQGAAFVVFKKMKENGFSPNLQDVEFFNRMDRVSSRKLQETTFPSIDYSKDLTERKWDNIKRRNEKTGKKYAHPWDYDVSYKDF